MSKNIVTNVVVVALKAISFPSFSNGSKQYACRFSYRHTIVIFDRIGVFHYIRCFLSICFPMQESYGNLSAYQPWPKQKMICLSCDLVILPLNLYCFFISFGNDALFFIKWVQLVKCSLSQVWLTLHALGLLILKFDWRYFH